MFRAGLYSRVSTNDQQTLAMQSRAMREYVARRGWTVALQVREVNSGAVRREAREKLLEAARRREIDVVLVWRLDRWGRSVTDLLATLQELEHLGVGFVSLTEALDLTTPAGRAMAGLLAIFAEFEREILRERTRAGLAHARENGKRLGRPATAVIHAAEIRKLHRAAVSKSEIARRLQIGRTSVRRILAGIPTRNRSARFPAQAGRKLTELQHDTSPHALELAGKKRKVQTASAVLGYSGMLFFQMLSDIPTFRLQGVSERRATLFLRRDQTGHDR